VKHTESNLLRYWANTLSSTDLDSLFSQMSSAGLKGTHFNLLATLLLRNKLLVLRIFGWSDNVGSPNNDNFQSWSGSTNTPNANAFAAHMDPIVNSAASHGIKLVVPLIGNWQVAHVIRPLCT
jgi:hypothetical protein